MKHHLEPLRFNSLDHFVMGATHFKRRAQKHLAVIKKRRKRKHRSTRPASAVPWDVIFAVITSDATTVSLPWWGAATSITNRECRVRCLDVP
ncbi:hypothetical protein EVAR_50230_1 [Eumeta japonica]|uniref:Uncharacterized protein n=1 Tax=Eumeta variegata TaxID=151549 RepID=A0A4C2A5T2_EUMVA|nr:hypothetical protein EVAR_50230_1 [Eumeta japonica]